MIAKFAISSVFITLKTPRYSTYASTSSALRLDADAVTAEVVDLEPEVVAFFLLPRSSHLRLPIRVSKCGAIEVGSWPAESIVWRILLRYASTVYKESIVSTGHAHVGGSKG